MANWFRKLFRDDSRSQTRSPAFPWQRVERFESRWALGGVGGLADTSSTDQPLDWEQTTTQEVAWEQATTSGADQGTADSDTGLPPATSDSNDESSSTQSSTANLLETALTQVTPTGATKPADRGPLDESANEESSNPPRSGEGSSNPSPVEGSTTEDEGGATVAPTAMFSSENGEGPGAGVNLGEDGGTLSNTSLGGAGPDGAGGMDAQALAQLGLELDEQGNAIGLVPGQTFGTVRAPWYESADEPVVVKYDFRDQNGFENLISADQMARTIDALNAWSDATGGQLIFVRDQEADLAHIVNFGTGDLRAFNLNSATGGTLGVAGGQLTRDDAGDFRVNGAAWLDVAEYWDTEIGNGNPAGTYDYFTVMAHEIGHTLGYGDSRNPGSRDIMGGIYDAERTRDTINHAAQTGLFYRGVEEGAPRTDFRVLPLTTAEAQLTAAEVRTLLDKASAVTASQDGIFAVVDRNGRILGVRVESQVLATITDQATLVFAIDGAVAKARTAAFFGSGDATIGSSGAPLTPRTIQYISQSTVTEREVEGNPNADNSSAAAAAASTTRGPGFVAPIGIGGHFPAGIMHTPPVDLFHIEHTNRDSYIAPGADGVKGTPDDIQLRTFTDALGREVNRFNMDPTFVPEGKGLFAPESYGTNQNSGLLPNATARGIATLPGGVGLYRDTNGDGVGDTIVGGIGVFFPGADGYATHEQGFVPGIGQTQEQRMGTAGCCGTITSAPRVLEAEFIAFVAAGGSVQAQLSGINGAKPDPTAPFDLPFGRIDLVGINLPIIGPIGCEPGPEILLDVADQFGTGTANGEDMPLIGGVDGKYRDGQTAPDGWLVMPHSSTVDPNLTQADVERIVSQGIQAANATRAAIRLPIGTRTRMVFAVTDTSGEVLGLYRMPDSTVFSIDVAVAKARNVSYYADPTDLQPEDTVTLPGVAFTNRTFRFLAEPRYPAGVDGSTPPAFSILNDPGVNRLTAENLGAPVTAGSFQSVAGHDSFNVMTNFRDPGDPSVVAQGGVSAPTANQNGIVFFPGSTPLYKNGQLIGGLGVSGDGVDQDDVVTFCAAQGYLPTAPVLRADQVYVDGVRLPFMKFLRNPFA